MKSNKKNIIVLFVLVMSFVFLPNIKFDFGYDQNSNVINPKESAGYLISFIHVDGNWSTTAFTYDWCSGDGSWGNPYTIENVTIDTPIGSGIFIDNSKNDYFIIRNCTVYNAGSLTYDAGIKLENTHKGTLTNNNCSNNPKHGILLYSFCDNNTLSGNTACNNKGWGIYIANNCDNNTVSENTANGNGQSGISLSNCDYNNITGNTANDNLGSSGIKLENCNNNTISGNIACNNTYTGIFLNNNCDNNTISGNTLNYNDVYGMYLNLCDNNTISGNTANGNDFVGIHLNADCDNNIISGNTANDNADSGIFFDGNNENNTISGNTLSNNLIGIFIHENSNENTIYGNFFLINGKHAVDNGTENTWNSTTIGNYWDNHTGPDTTPQDGIVDNPYTFIGGLAGSIDYLPIAGDGAPSITINSPYPSGIFDSTAPSFNVRITDDHLDAMWYTIDGGLHNYTFTNNGTIDPSAWNALSDGVITLQFYANDTLGNVESAGVNIIKDTVAPRITINSPDPGEIFGNDAPSYNVTVTDPNLDSVWLVFEGVTLNLNTPIVGTINNAAWLALPEGTYTITFYANDTVGHETSKAITITKSVPSDQGIGLDNFMTSFLIFIMGGMAIIVIITRIHLKKRITAA